MCGWQYGNIINSKQTKKEKEEYRKEVQELVNNEELLKPDPEKPSAMTAFLLILFPIILIIIGSIASVILSKGSTIYLIFTFLGNNNIALFLAMILSGVVLRKYILKNTQMNYELIILLDECSF